MGPRQLRVLERFPTYLNRISGPKNALALCFKEHLYPMDDPIRSDDALERFPTYLNRISSPKNALALCFNEHLYPTGDPIRSDDALIRKNSYPSGASPNG
jgi:hypothetical protein